MCLDLYGRVVYLRLEPSKWNLTAARLFLHKNMPLREGVHALLEDEGSNLRTPRDIVAHGKNLAKKLIESTIL